MVDEHIRNAVVSALSGYPIDNPAFVRVVINRVAELAGDAVAECAHQILAQE